MNELKWRKQSPKYADGAWWAVRDNDGGVSLARHAESYLDYVWSTEVHVGEMEYAGPFGDPIAACAWLDRHRGDPAVEPEPEPEKLPVYPGEWFVVDACRSMIRNESEPIAGVYMQMQDTPDGRRYGTAILMAAAKRMYRLLDVGSVIRKTEDWREWQGEVQKFLDELGVRVDD